MTNQEINVQQCFPLTRTSFCISADDFFPELLTQQLGISPTAAWKKGQLRQDRGGNKYYEKIIGFIGCDSSIIHFCPARGCKEANDKV